MVRVLIVENILLTSEMFSAVLEEQHDFKVIAVCASAVQALTKIGAADVVLVSTGLSEDGAYRLTRALAGGGSEARILIVGQSETNKAILRYIEAGAHGFIRRKDPIGDLPKKIRRAVRGEVILSPDLVPDLVARLTELARCFEGTSQRSSQLACLTPREREVLQLIGRNYSNRDIADQLIIEIGTVKNHVHNILSKLNVSSRREAASYLPGIYVDLGSEPVSDYSYLVAASKLYLRS